MSRPGRLLNKALQAGVGGMQLGVGAVALTAQTGVGIVRDGTRSLLLLGESEAEQEAAALKKQVETMQAELLGKEARIAEIEETLSREQARKDDMSIDTMLRASTRLRLSCTRASY